MFQKICGKTLAFLGVVFFLNFNSFSQTGQKKYSSDQEQGFEAYRKGNWIDAQFFLKKVGASDAGYDPETLYMLVMSQMNAGEYKSAGFDADLFLKKFPSSFYAPYMQFQKGKALHLLGKNEDAVLVLSDFCHQYQDSELYSSALYWIAECFYAEYNFDSARALYERIVLDFPADDKVLDAKYRIEMISQREREEKLIYLLKVTGEENLAAREEYERQMRMLQTEDKMGMRKSMLDAQNKISDLENRLENEKKRSAEFEMQAQNLMSENQRLNAALENAGKSAESKFENASGGFAPEKSPDYDSSGYYEIDEKDPEVEALKRKARQLQHILDLQNKIE